DHLRLVTLQFMGLHQRVSHDYDEIAYMHQAGGRAVNANFPGLGLAHNGVGFEPMAIVDVYDLDFFEFTDISKTHEDRIDGNRSVVTQVRIRYRSAMDLRFQDVP